MRFLCGYRRAVRQMTVNSEVISMTGYCMKCRESREIQEFQQVTMKNRRPATRGRCGECGSMMFRIGKAS